MRAIEHLNAALPKRLFHYTDQQGLLGIMQSNSLWATSARYLNDTSEFQHAQELTRQKIFVRINRSEDGPERGIYQDMRKAIDYANSTVFVASLSEEGDSLSQWRAYGGKAGGDHATGYAIEFSPELLRLAAAKSAMTLVKCEYDLEAQDAIIEEFIDQTIESCLAKYKADTYYDDSQEYLSAEMAELLERYAVLLKPPAFSAEREWRLVSMSRGTTLSELRFRPGRASIIPYLAIPFSPEAGEISPVSGLIVGPSPDPKEAISAAKLLLRSCGFNPLPNMIKRSIVPYRTW